MLGTGDLRAASDLPSSFCENKPAALLVFHNSDTEPEQRFWDEYVSRQTSDLNRLSLEIATTQSNRRRSKLMQTFDSVHYQELAAEGRHSSRKPFRAMAVALDKPEDFDRLTAELGAAFRADTRSVGELTLTAVFIPALTPENTGPSRASQVTFSPRLNPVPQLAAPNLSSTSPQDADQVACASGLVRRLISRLTQ